MDTTRLTPNRRQLLAGAALTAAALVPMRGLAANLTPDTSAWDAALADYLAKRAYCNGLDPEADEDATDDAIDAYCDAMDHLINEVPAPNVEATQLKLRLAEERGEACQEYLFRDHAKAIIADLTRFATRRA